LPTNDLRDSLAVTSASKKDILQPTQQSAHEQQSAYKQESTQIDTKETEAKGNSKVESIRITAPGTYELNLPSLFEREELIMEVKEGTYLIDLTSAFRKGKKE